MPRTLSDEDVDAVAQRVVTWLDADARSLRRIDRERFVSSTAVMTLLKYRNRSAFWQFVHRCGVPYVRLGPRKILFDSRQLEDWIDRRSTGVNRRSSW